MWRTLGHGTSSLMAVLWVSGRSRGSVMVSQLRADAEQTDYDIGLHARKPAGTSLGVGRCGQFPNLVG